jgi:TonB family protein
MGDLKNDIEKYLRGELSPHEMHLLERKALNDPFLADALEGIGSIDEQDFSADIKNLQAALDDRTQKTKKIIPLWHLPARIAAGIIALAVTGYVIFNLMKENDQDGTLALTKRETTPEIEKNLQQLSGESVAPVDSIASSKPKEEKSVAANLRLSKKNEAVSEEELPVSTFSYEVTDNQPVVEEKEIGAGPDDLKVQRNEAQRDEPAVKPATPQPLAEKKEMYDKRKSNDMASETVAATRIPNKTSEQKRRVLTGKVTDAEDGSPMPGVNVTIKGTQIGVVTNEEGNYKLPLRDTVGEVVFSFIGMQSTEVAITTADSVNAQLSPDFSALSEVVVVGYASPNDADFIREKENIYKLAAPEGGRKAFKNYLVQNVKYPQQAIENKIQGKVTVQFTVGPDGLLYDFKVVKGIGYGCDEEVIRLIKQGPKWTATSRNDTPLTGKVKVRLKFALPD